jgi:hypothetical protein
MNKVMVMPVLAAVLFAAACGEGGGPVQVVPTASVRFVNATTGMPGSGGFTANGQFATGSALPFGQAAQTCSQVEEGSTSFGFGAANAGGTGLSGTALTTLDNQSVTAGGNLTLAATGSAASPTLFLLDNRFSGSLATNQAAVRFVNLAPGTGESANAFTVLKGVLGQGHTLVQGSIAVGAPTAFNAVASGSNVYTILKAHETVISGSAATLILQAGTVNTVAIVSNAASNGFQLVNIPGC